jgi:hypothetical protein
VCVVGSLWHRVLGVLLVVACVHVHVHVGNLCTAEAKAAPSGAGCLPAVGVQGFGWLERRSSGPGVAGGCRVSRGLWCACSRGCCSCPTRQQHLNCAFSACRHWCQVAPILNGWQGQVARMTLPLQAHAVRSANAQCTALLDALEWWHVGSSHVYHNAAWHMCQYLAFLAYMAGCVAWLC